MEGTERPERDRARGHDRPRRDADRRHRSRSRSPGDRDDYARRRSRSPRRRSPSPRARRRSYSRSASPANRRERDRDRHEGKRRDSRSRSRSRERRRDRGGDRDKDGERRRRSRSRSSSSSEDSEEERERRHRRKKDKHRKRSRSRSREKDRDKDKDRKEKKKKSKKDKKKHKSGAVGHHQWGKYGVINESDLYNKEQEFRAWLVEERKINPETITKDQTKKEFARFAEDYNTATLPHEKFYNMDEYERRMTALRAGEYVPPADDGYDPTADMRAHASTHKRRAVEHDSYMNKEQLMELRKVQNERIQAGKMKLLGMEIKQNMGVRMDGTMFDG